MINTLLAAHPSLYYYQGFHDVATVFLLLVGEARAYPMLERVALHHLRPALTSNLESMLQLLSLLPHLIAFACPKLHTFLLRAGVEPYYAISWVLTWFAHDVDQWESITRLYDAFLASHPMFCLYLAAILVARSHPDILRQECDYPTVHSYLSRLPGLLNQIQVAEECVQDAAKLMDQFPPSSLVVRAKSPIPPTSPFLAYPYPWMKVPSAGKKLLRWSRMHWWPAKSFYMYSFLLVLSSFSFLAVYVFHTTFS